MNIPTTSSSLTLTPAVSNSSGLRSVPGPRAGNLRRDAGLRIRLDGKEFWLLLYGDLIPTPGDSWDARLPLTCDDILNASQTCYRAWQKAIVELAAPVVTRHGTTENRFPFQDAWDYISRPEFKQQAGERMAVAGAKLFFQLFEQPAQQVPELQRIVDRLREASRTKDPLVLTIISNEFFAPWPMLYVHPNVAEALAPDGRNFQWEGFWGYRHIVEHNPESVDVQVRLGPGNGAQLTFSANIDKRIDAQFGCQCIQSQVSFFEQQAHLARVLRTTKSELRDAFSGTNFADHILYFCCHSVSSVQADGRVNPWEVQIALSDAEEITVSDINFWLGKRVFLRQPFVFINACQAGQFSTRFYGTLAAEFLRRKAVGFIAPLIDMPVVFAAEYCVRFFRRLFGGTADQPQRIGPLVRDLAREFVNKENNPLGLVYALYRGTDCFI